MTVWRARTATEEQPGDILRLLAEEEQLRRRLSLLRRAPAAPQSPSPPEEAARGNGERERLEARLDDVVELRLARGAPSGGPGGAESMPRLAELQASLAAHEMALCYHIGTDAVIAWAVTAERLRTYTLPVSLRPAGGTGRRGDAALPGGRPRRGRSAGRHRPARRRAAGALVPRSKPARPPAS